MPLWPRFHMLLDLGVNAGMRCQLLQERYRAITSGMYVCWRSLGRGHGGGNHISSAAGRSLGRGKVVGITSAWQQHKPGLRYNQLQ